jgi:ParB/RepB/Spo0J family partition protein
MAALRLLTVPLKLCDIAYNPRSARDPVYCRSLGENIRTNGQNVPIIGFFQAERFQVADGGCRVEGMRVVGLTDALALDWGKEPTPADLLMAHASIDLHKQFLPPLDRARLFRSLLDARSCTAKQLAQDLSISDSLVGRYLSVLTLPADLQEQVNTGALDFGKACILAQEPDPARQRALAAVAPGTSRDALAALARKGRQSSTPATKVNRVKCALSSGVQVVVSGNGVTLDQSIEALGEALKEMKRARELGYTAKTFTAAMQDKAKAGA